MNMVLQYKDRLYNQSRYICKRTCRPSTFIRSAKPTGKRTVAPICSQLDIDVFSGSCVNVVFGDGRCVLIGVIDL